MHRSPECTSRNPQLNSYLAAEFIGSVIRSPQLNLCLNLFVNLKDEASKKIAFHFQCSTWKLEKALGEIPYDQFEISEEVEEQVRLT